MSVFDAYAKYYDLLYRDKDYRGEARGVGELLRRHGVGSGDLLELGCGTGKHAEHLGAEGYRVHGVDLSAGMVAQARARLGGAPERFTFEVGDARSVRVDRVFDAVVSLFHVVSYQASNCDQDELFRTASTHLRPGGLFVFDFWHGPGVLSDPPSVRVKELGDAEVEVMRIAQPTMHPNDNCVDVDYTVLVTDKSTQAVHRIHERHRMRYLFGPEIERLATAHGLAVVQAFGATPGQALDRDAWVGTVVARKP